MPKSPHLSAEALADRTKRIAEAEEKILRLREREAKYKEEVRRIKNELAQENRRRDTKKKIIAGAIVLKCIDENRFPKSTEDFMKVLHSWVTKNEERDLFGLPHVAPTPDESDTARHASPPQG